MEEENCPSPIWGTFGGNWGPGRIISPVAVQPGLARLASFYSITVPLVQFFRAAGVRHVCHDNDGCFVRVYADPVSQVTSIKAG